MDNPKIYIRVSGGVVQSVRVSPELSNVQVNIMDYDNADGDPKLKEELDRQEKDLPNMVELNLS